MKMNKFIESIYGSIEDVCTHIFSLKIQNIEKYFDKATISERIFNLR